MHLGDRYDGDEICKYSLHERSGLCGLFKRRMSCLWRLSFLLARSFFGELNVLHMRIIKEETICSTCFNKHTANLKTDHHE